MTWSADRIAVAICAFLAAVAAALFVVGARDSVGRTILGVILGLLIMAVFLLARSRPSHPVNRANAWVVPVTGIAGTLVLASLPDDWQPVAWGIFSGGLLGAAAGVVLTRRRLGRPPA